jgi:peptidoglycan/LPS O-acetylase OafA/YrhL
VIMRPRQSVPRLSSIDSLTGLRYFAAAGVVFHHYGKEHLQQVPDFVKYIAGGGDNGVSLFFILSGFVLAYNYLDSYECLDKVDFWRARFARIYPVYLLSLLLTLNRFVDHVHYVLQPFSLGGVARALKSFAMAVTLTQAWDIKQDAVWNVPAWTLSVEMLFYLTFPWVFRAICRLKPTRLVAAVCGLVIFSIGIRVLYLLISGGFAHRPPGDFGFKVIAQWPPARMPEFLIGLILGRMYRVRPDLRIRHRNAASILAILAIWTVLGLGPGLYTIPLLDVPFALIIYTLASGPGIVSDFLSRPSLVLLGNASYAVYILQVPVMKSAIQVFGSGWLGFWASLLVLTGVSIAVYLYIEAPARKWLRSRWAGRSEALRPATALA